MERRKPRNKGSAGNQDERQVIASARQKNIKATRLISGSKRGKRIGEHLGTWPTPFDKLLVALLIFLVVALIGAYLTADIWSEPIFRDAMTMWTGTVESYDNGVLEVAGEPSGHGTLRLPESDRMAFEVGRRYRIIFWTVKGQDRLIAWEDITDR